MSPKQIAAKAIFENLDAFLDACHTSVGRVDYGRKNPVKEAKAVEAVDNIARAFVSKMEKLCKKKLGKSVADEIDAADKKDAKKPAKDENDGAGF